MFKTIIGLEIHVQLKTKSKMFCRCDNNAENAAPNSLVCPICLGLPGVLPVANRQAIEWTLKTGLALNCEIAEHSRFDRKHYFYPDLPKNYQISQYDRPFAEDGELEIRNQNDETRNISITRVHLEEDAGKLLHIADSISPIVENDKPHAISDKQGYTLVDLNRAGTPLMEIVTEPEISSPGEAKIFMQELRSILRYLDVSDADMEKGHLRCDANISITEVDDSHPERSEGSPANAGSGTSPEILRVAQNDKFQMGTPAEIKNLNSFRMVERALLYEEKRQQELLEKGEKVTKETRGWDDAKGITYSQRSKEIAQDYRYFPEPDLPPFDLKEFEIEKIKAEISELPAAKRTKYINSMGLSVQDAAVLSFDHQMAQYFEKIAEKVSPKLAANWVINELKIDGILAVSPENMAAMLGLLEKGEISGKIAKEVLVEMIATGKQAKEIIVKKGFKQVADETEIGKIIDKVIAENPQAIADLKKGKKEVMGYLVGQVMKATNGQARPELVNKILKTKIEGEKNI